MNVNQSPDLVLNKIIDVWLDKMPLVSQLEKKKLLGLALSSLLTANSRFVLKIISIIFCFFNFLITILIFL